MNDTASSPIIWHTLNDDDLLNTRFCDLGLTIKNTALEKPINQLYQELNDKNLLIRPPCYLGDEWFSPDGFLAIAMPFYLAHPRLIQLEKKIMLEVDGGSAQECMKLLRHETGHALCHAFRLTRKKQWKQIFGSPAQDFSDFYYYQPYSKRYVHHLENWYAQSHPEEDFAETFAVWLTPGSDWKIHYQDWPAMNKLLYVDKLMSSLQGTLPLVTEYSELYAIKRSRKKLKTHYEQRKKYYADDDPAFFDQDLLRLFHPESQLEKSAKKASGFLRQNKKQLMTIIPRWTHERKFTVNRLIKKLTERCDTLNLRVTQDESTLLATVASYLTALTSAYLFTGKFKVRP